MLFLAANKQHLASPWIIPRRLIGRLRSTSHKQPQRRAPQPRERRAKRRTQARQLKAVRRRKEGLFGSRVVTNLLPPVEPLGKPRSGRNWEGGRRRSRTGENAVAFLFNP